MWRLPQKWNLLKNNFFIKKLDMHEHYIYEYGCLTLKVFNIDDPFYLVNLQQDKFEFNMFEIIAFS